MRCDGKALVFVSLSNSNPLLFYRCRTRLKGGHGNLKNPPLTLRFAQMQMTALVQWTMHVAQISHSVALFSMGEEKVSIVAVHSSNSSIYMAAKYIF